MSSSSWRRRSSIALLHSTSMGFPTELEWSVPPLSLGSARNADKLRETSSLRSSGDNPLVSGRYMATNIIVDARTTINGANESAPKLLCRYGNAIPTTKFEAQFTWLVFALEVIRQVSPVSFKQTEIFSITYHDTDIAVATYRGSNISGRCGILLVVL